MLLGDMRLIREKSLRMKIFDISWPLSSATTSYKDKHTIRFEETKNFNKDGVRETIITLSSHSGTHVDAPSHFLRDGKTIDEMHLDRLIGRCLVLNLETVDAAITHEDLKKYADEIQENDIVLLKTANSLKKTTDKFWPDFIYLAVSGANYLYERGVKAVGIDYLGIERGNPDHDTHQFLMKRDIAIIEGLRLGHVQEGRYQLYCLPLNIVGLEAAPARAILIKE